MTEWFRRGRRLVAKPVKAVPLPPPRPGPKSSPWSEYLQSWLDNPDGGAGYFKYIGDKVRVHDRTCESLREVWKPRKGGKSCPSDLTDCHRCGVTFYSDGVYPMFEECPESWHWYCDCCLKVVETCGCDSSPE